jgi:hypothetical protein
MAAFAGILSLTLRTDELFWRDLCACRCCCSALADAAAATTLAMSPMLTVPFDCNQASSDADRDKPILKSSSNKL